MASNKRICTFGGTKKTHPASVGRPLPGKCSRKEGNKPHSWVKNKKR